MNDKIGNYELLIRESHLDFVGHVNNATYLQIFEEARWEWIGEKGYGMSEIKRLGISPVVLEVCVKFLKEVTLRTLVRVETRAISFSGKVGVLEQKMIGPEGQCFCSASMKYGLFDLKTRRLVTPPAEWSELME